MPVAGSDGGDGGKDKGVPLSVKNLGLSVEIETRSLVTGGPVGSDTNPNPLTQVGLCVTKQSSSGSVSVYASGNNTQMFTYNTATPAWELAEGEEALYLYSEKGTVYAYSPADKSVSLSGTPKVPVMSSVKVSEKQNFVFNDGGGVVERMDEQLYNEYRGIMAQLRQTIEDVHKFQDEETGMFWQVMDHPGVEGNYLETSGTALFAYAVLKGVRLGYLPKRMAAWAEKAFYGTCDRYLSKNPDGSLQLDGICLVAGLGGKDHRDGSLAYYFSEPVVCNDAKGVGPLVLAYTEMIARK